jgi:hypothetical protein
MKSFIFQELLKPVVHRLGSQLGLVLAATDAFTDGQIATIEQAAILIAGFCIDLIVRKSV